MQLPVRWNPYIVALSFLVGFLGSYTASILMYNFSKSKTQKEKLLWLGGACSMYGVGSVWALHFTGMMAIDIQVRINYDFFLTAFSALIATAGATASFWSKYRNMFSSVERPQEQLETAPLLHAIEVDDTRPDMPPPSWKQRIWKEVHAMSRPLPVMGGFFLTLAIGGMHYCGMMAMSIDKVQIRFRVETIWFSFLVTWIMCIVATRILPEHMNIVQQIWFSVVSTAAVFLLHYMGMYATSFHADHLPEHPEKSFSDEFPFIISVMVIVSCFTVTSVSAYQTAKQRDVLQDVLVTRRYIDTLRLQKEEAEKSAQQKMDFIAIASHEIRTPLHAIAGFIELLSTTNVDPTQADYINTAKSAVSSLELIVNNVLDFANLESDNVSVQPRMVDLVPASADLIKALTSFVDKPLDVLFVVGNETYFEAFFDDRLFCQIKQNIISNAIKFTSEGHVLIKLSATDQYVEFVTEDTGIGMSKEFQQNLFVPFHQHDTSLTRLNTGTGLGMSISKRITDILEGTIGVQSDVGKGSTFTVRIPLSVGPVYKNELYPEKIAFKIDIQCRNSSTAAIVKRELTRWVADGDHDNTLVWIDAELWGEYDPIPNNLYVVVHGKMKSLERRDGRENVMYAQRPVIFYQIYNNLLYKLKLTISHGVSDSSGDGKTEEKKRPRKILIVEDNRVNQKLAEQFLKKLGFVCDIVENGKEAVRNVTELNMHYDLILMDLQMPIMDGFEATQIIRNNTSRHVPIVALTANVSEYSKGHAVDVGMDGFLTKPLRLKTLKETLEKFLGDDVT